jgi:thiol-disulfide isomerase/thioredoxin
MRLPFVLYFFFSMLLTDTAFSQAVNNDSFTITGKIIGRDTGIVVLNYFNPYNEKATYVLKNGKFRFTGNVNNISDAYIWTDTSNHNFSDRTVIRFLLEPGNIQIYYKNYNAIIKGSKAQEEKENFDRIKSDLVIPKNQFQAEIDSLFRLAKHLPASDRVRIDELYRKIYDINKRMMPIDMQYIRSHPGSYFSGFLLSTYTRRLPLDTLQVYYTLLSNAVKASTEGRKVIEYIYPLTTDVDFRNKNPIFGLEFNKRLNELTSVHEISLKDTSGTLINLKSFKGKYLLIDFWASWCGPCIKNIPALEKLMKKYSTDPIQFIAVSIDTDSIDWKESIKKNRFSGTQLCDLKGFKGILTEYCKVVTSIPRYVLIDKEGKIINYDMPQPLNPELEELIDKLLKKG